MKKLVLFAALAFIITAAAAAEETFMSVQVRETPVRSAPSFLGSITGTLVYTDRVVLEEERAGWGKVSFPEKEISGWLHMSALSKKEIVYQSGESAGTKASSSEVSLAGKGFNEQVEAKFKEEKDLDYDTIDRMEREMGYDPEELAMFLAEGALEPSMEAAE